ncbi:MAG: M20/M25/M40 family metallo-hydrolase, partial [Spirochaetota bacterium]
MNQPQEPNKSISLADKLSSLLRFPSVSSYDPRQEDESAFRGVVDSLPGLFPRVGAALECFRIGPRALLYAWKGSEEHLPPAVLCAHFDVVPAPDPESWANPPFSGAIAEGCVWGRGAQDIKVLMASILEAAE